MVLQNPPIIYTHPVLLHLTSFSLLVHLSLFMYRYLYVCTLLPLFAMFPGLNDEDANCTVQNN